mmetsp:Transcript_5142/g.7114  ORF Transcript_5142/g.7114 Transcript_5142/m.7114 type:complete len:600 (+) Transcript_5142:313-2112(+)|eukprot:CAMPEP_0117758032 /NCGR_PEP_ID=MMETSP0947-20121206/15126_1 /TAXON_ID=44440 /ORGANISM="Chattonella subsalsa, Strain CCMP2191" /LENGTH=599 /DNA_ID=CAMNT_0005578121 /DNA_START=235 /DNA_END=2034 /DNA_ORIENTATION=+
MGSFPSRLHSIPSSESLNPSNTIWTKTADHAEYLNSDLLPDCEDVTAYAELLAVLDSPVGQRHLGLYAKKIFTQELLLFWTDCQVYRSIPTHDYRRAKAGNIYNKYIKSGAVRELGFVTEADKHEFSIVINKAKEDASILGSDLYDQLLKRCFLEIFQQIFIRFKADDEAYIEYKAESDATYNVVDVNDFDYMELLGAGAFGRVVHVRKKSTGNHYAMKIQVKRDLISNFRDDLSKLENEKIVFAACNHPFILDMHYSFQTELYVVLVLHLVTAGNLQDAIDESQLGRLPEDRARFYTAEIALALFHLHDMGLMYRDLKPRNVLLNEDGHVLLADMGGVGDFAGTVFSKTLKKPNTKLQPTNSINGEDSESWRRISIIGTKGYMAPEVVRLMSPADGPRKGYTKAVDYWSLGVTAYKLLTGRRPFDNPKSSFFHKSRQSYRSEYESLLSKKVEYPSYVSAEAKSFIQECLDINEETRMGGQGGRQRLENHPWFAQTDWAALLARTVPLPFVPPSQPPIETSLYPSYTAMMETLDQEDQGMRNRRRRSVRAPSKEQQKYFRNWNYISPHTLKVEMGIANEQEVLNTNFKAQQMMGHQPGS